MSRLDIVAVALRVFALFLVVLAIRMTGVFAQVLTTSGWADTAFYFAFTVVPPIAAALLIWFFPLTLAAKFLPVAREPVQPITSDPDRLQEVGFSLLGLWVLCTAISDAVYWVGYLVATSQMSIPMEPVSPDQKASIIATFVEFAVGVWLLLGSRGFIGAIRKFRQAGS